jgi:hypothetical protein
MSLGEHAKDLVLQDAAPAESGALGFLSLLRIGSRQIEAALRPLSSPHPLTPSPHSLSDKMTLLSLYQTPSYQKISLE